MITCPALLHHLRVEGIMCSFGEVSLEYKQALLLYCGKSRGIRD
uniref:LITAF domain-containing protein n=1 Tax=Mesocestoides corti TaxID=53468 RepID=A0A5K3FFI5_MESCO